MAIYLRRDGTVLLSPVWHEWRDGGVPQTAQRIAARYIDEERGTAYVASLPGEHVIVRLDPGALRAWDFADEYD